MLQDLYAKDIKLLSPPHTHPLAAMDPHGPTLHYTNLNIETKKNGL